MKFASSAMGPCSAPRDAKINRHVKPADTPAHGQQPAMTRVHIRPMPVAGTVVLGVAHQRGECHDKEHCHGAPSTGHKPLQKPAAADAARVFGSAPLLMYSLPGSITCRRQGWPHQRHIRADNRHCRKAALEHAFQKEDREVPTLCLSHIFARSMCLLFCFARPQLLTSTTSQGCCRSWQYLSACVCSCKVHQDSDLMQRMQSAVVALDTSCESV